MTDETLRPTSGTMPAAEATFEFSAKAVDAPADSADVAATADAAADAPKPTPAPQPYDGKIRVGFCKTGRLALLSHLEVARSLERAVRRAGVPYAISQGFSPHMRIAFGSALPVGVGSTCEVFDLKLTRPVDLDETLAALRASSAPDLMPHSVEWLERGAAAASAAFPFARYELVYSADPGELVVPETVEVVRKRKQRTLVVSDYLHALVQDGPRVSFCLESLATGSLRPDLLARELLAASGAPEDVRVLSIVRTAQAADLEGLG